MGVSDARRRVALETMAYMRMYWVYQFRDGPECQVVEVLAEGDGKPRQVQVRESRSRGLVDGYVLRHADGSTRVAVYTWVRRGKPEPVTAHLLELLAEVCPQENA
ncbi:hypothetical protein ACFWCB_22700 [Streptomyces sp. NPDC060048]|uniref:hypothetical protein n=1 Tax=unclassified Streptomyces TaxID=2593676 RepID=UPI0036A7A51B